MDVSEGEYVVDYDRRGLIRARFIVSADKMPWSLVDMLDGKVRAKVAGASIYKMKRTAYDMKRNLAQWSVKWEYPGREQRSFFTI